jgi:hypothetical protein
MGLMGARSNYNKSGDVVGMLLLDMILEGS